MSASAGFQEIADRVWGWRHDWLDLNVCVVGGERGLVLVDPHGSAAAGREVLAALGRIAHPGDLVAAVNTHEHFDHTFGNAALREAHPDLPIHATDTAVERTPISGRRSTDEFARSDDPRRDEVLATTIVAADHPFSSAAVIDLGDRIVELVHPGRGHTGGDLVVRVPDADVLLAGDLVEESAPPAYGVDSHPLEWAATLDLVLQLVAPTTTVVPGHGALVDRSFVESQCDEIRAVGETLRELAAAGVAEDDALARGTWPFPDAVVAPAIAAAYASLPRARRQLPLL